MRQFAPGDFERHSGQLFEIALRAAAYVTNEIDYDSYDWLEKDELVIFISEWIRYRGDRPVIGVNVLCKYGIRTLFPRDIDTFSPTHDSRGTHGDSAGVE